MVVSRLGLMLLALVWAHPARAQAVFDDFFGPPTQAPPKPKPKPRPAAVKTPSPIEQPAAAPAGPKPAATTTVPANPPAVPATKPAVTTAPAAPKPTAAPTQPAAKPVPQAVAREAPPPPAVPPAQKPAPAVAAQPVAPAAAPAAAPAQLPATTAPAPAAPPAARTAALPPEGAAPGLPPPPKPANCKNSGNFPAWLAEFRREASLAGVSAATLSDALDGMTLDQSIINRDRGQRVFTQSFLDFYGKLANPSRFKSSVFKLNKHKALFQRAEAEYGVPGPVLVAFWALESDFGTGMGNLPILRSLATLAYDCRRGELFRGELMAALKLIDRGDFSKETLVGSWAGEIGQTQFLPGHVLRYSIDYDGDGRSDLYRNAADIIGTSANFVRDLGWRPGEPWVREVRVSKNVPWDQADLAIKHPISQWAAWGVTALDGGPLPDGPLASLVLPMGRFGPALLAYPNFEVYTKWNQSLVYALTAAHLAARVAGDPVISRGSPDIPLLDHAAVKELQVLLNRSGWQVGEPDGKLGAGTRAAVKQAQLKLGLPADSYPTPELLAALRAGY